MQASFALPFPESSAGFQPASRRDGGDRLLCGHFFEEGARRVKWQDILYPV